MSHNTKLCVKSFAKRKTTHEFQVVSRCKSAEAENIYFAVLAKSFATLLFEHISEENRKICIAFRQAELMTNVSTLVIVSWLACVGLDILAL